MIQSVEMQSPALSASPRTPREMMYELSATIERLNDVLERQLPALSAKVFLEAASPSPVAPIRLPVRTRA